MREWLGRGRNCVSPSIQDLVEWELVAKERFVTVMCRRLGEEEERLWESGLRLQRVMPSPNTAVQRTQPDKRSSSSCTTASSCSGQQENTYVDARRMGGQGSHSRFIQRSWTNRTTDSKFRSVADIIRQSPDRRTGLLSGPN